MWQVDGAWWWRLLGEAEWGELSRQEAAGWCPVLGQGLELGLGSQTFPKHPNRMSLHTEREWWHTSSPWGLRLSLPARWGLELRGGRDTRNPSLSSGWNIISRINLLWIGVGRGYYEEHTTWLSSACFWTQSQPFLWARSTQVQRDLY